MSNNYKFTNDSIAPIRIQNASLNTIASPQITTNITELYNNTYEAYVNYWPDLLAAYDADPNGRTITEFGRIHYRDNGENEGRVLMDPNDVRAYIGYENNQLENAIHTITLADQLSHSTQSKDIILEPIGTWTGAGQYTTSIPEDGEYVFVVVGGGASGHGARGDDGYTPGGAGGGAGGTGVYYIENTQLHVEMDVGAGGVSSVQNGSGSTPGGNTTVKFSDDVEVLAKGGGVDTTVTTFGGDASITGAYSADNFKNYIGASGGVAGSVGQNNPGQKGGGVAPVAPTVRITARGVSRGASWSFFGKTQYTYMADQEFDVSLTWPDQTGVMINLNWYDAYGYSAPGHSKSAANPTVERKTNNPILVTLQSDGKIVSNLGDQSYNGVAALSDVVIRVDGVVVYDQNASGAAQTGVLADISTIRNPGELFTHHGTGGDGGAANSNYYDSPGGGGGNIGYNISDIPSLRRIDHAERMFGTGGKGGDGNQPPQPDTAIRVTGTARDYYLERFASRGTTTVRAESARSLAIDFDETINWPSQAGQAIVSRTLTTKTYNDRQKALDIRAVDTASNLQINNAGVLGSFSGLNYANIKVYINGVLVYEQPDSEDYNGNTYVDVSEIIQPGGFAGIGEPATGVGNGGGGTGANTSNTGYKPGGDGADGGVFLYRINRKSDFGYKSVINVSDLATGCKVDLQIAGDIPADTHVEQSIVFSDQPIAIGVTDKLGDSRTQASTTYTHVTGSYTFEQAREDAITRGGELAQFKNPAQLAAFNNYLDTIPGYNYGWIGLTDTQTEGTWRWLDGTIASSDTLNWYSVTDPNGGTNENYVVVPEWTGGKWGDTYDNVYSYFMQTAAAANRGITLVETDLPDSTFVYVDNQGSGVYQYDCGLYSTPGELRGYNPFGINTPTATVTRSGAAFNTTGGTLNSNQALDISIEFPPTAPSIVFDSTNTDNLYLTIDWLCPATGNSRQDMQLNFPVQYTTATKLATPYETIYLCWAGVNGAPVEMKLKTRDTLSTYGAFASTQGKYYEGAGEFTRDGDTITGNWSLRPVQRELGGTTTGAQTTTWGLYFTPTGPQYIKKLTQLILIYTGSVDNSFINEYSYYLHDNDMRNEWYNSSSYTNGELELNMMFCFHEPKQNNASNNTNIMSDFRVFNRVDKERNDILQLEWDRFNSSVAQDVVYFVEYISTLGETNTYVIPDILEENSCTYQIKTSDDMTRCEVKYSTSNSDRLTGYMYTNNQVEVRPISLASYSRVNYQRQTRMGTLPSVTFDYKRASGSIQTTVPGNIYSYDPVDDTWIEQYKHMADAGMTVRLHATENIVRIGGPDTPLDVQNVYTGDTSSNNYTFRNMPGFTSGGVINVDTAIGTVTRKFQLPGLGAPGASVRVTGKGSSRTGYYSHQSRGGYDGCNICPGAKYTVSGPSAFDKTFQWPIQSGTVASFTWMTVGGGRSCHGRCMTTTWKRNEPSTITLQADGKIAANNNNASLHDIKVYVDDQLVYEQPAGDTSTSYVDVSQYVQD